MAFVVSCAVIVVRRLTMILYVIAQQLSSRLQGNNQHIWILMKSLSRHYLSVDGRTCHLYPPADRGYPLADNERIFLPSASG
jgi:hypothetical protein